MRGYLNIHTVGEDDSKELIYESENIIVDGAKDTIVNMLTYKNPAASTLTVSSTSSLMNNSNFTVGAMSLGPSRWDLDLSLAKGTAGFKASTSGTGNRFPVMPTPADTTLQPIDASNHLGHHLNYFEFSGNVDGIRHLSWEDASGHLTFYGSYAPATGPSALAEGGYLNSRSAVDKYGFIYRNPQSNFRMTSTTGAASDSGNNLTVSSCVSGFGISSTNGGSTQPATFKTAGQAYVTYVLCLHKGDVDWLREKYGGIDTMGLWVWDYHENLRRLGIPGNQGNPNALSEAWVPYGQGCTLGSDGKYDTSLYNFENLTTFPQFKLFAKRVMFPDGLQVPTHETSYKFMLIEWKITFA